MLALRATPRLSAPLELLIVGLPLAIWVACLLYTVRGFELAGGELLIWRLLWTTRVGLDGLRAADHDPAAVAASLRTFGNGGLFSFSGWFWNKRLGHYRGYLTDRSRAVLLRWDGRTIAVSPDRPEDFVTAIRRARAL